MKAFRSGNNVVVAIPKAMAARYEIEPGSMLEPVETPEGILLRTVEIVPRVAPEWRGSYARVLERHRDALAEID